MMPVYPTIRYTIKEAMAWIVDDLKVSHYENDIVENFMQFTKDTFEYITKLKTPRIKNT